MSSAVTVEGLVPVPQEEVALLLEAGYLYLEMEKTREAEEIFQGVASLVPHSEVPLLCLGNLYFSRGRFDRALKFHRDAKKRNPSSALACAHEGEALLFLKRIEEAKRALHHAVEVASADEPDDDAAAFAQSLLDAIAAEVL